MHPRAPKLLEDIRSAADFVKNATDGLALQEFKQNRLLRQAVERNFEIIGEAMRRLEKDDPDTAARITDYRRIIAFRNVLIHGYDVIDPAIVWSAVEVDLAPLLADVQVLLNSVG
ncbi:MAG: HepT-like ribonuclease domain-containing protein [Burkholderiales bacterium]|nr:HepT-like ribonuclease domain-containing protein [Burkholderiales bacterium]